MRYLFPVVVLGILIPSVFRSNVEAAIPVPAGLNAGDPYHLIFASSVANDANFRGITGITGADGFVQTHRVPCASGITMRRTVSKGRPHRNVI